MEEGIGLEEVWLSVLWLGDKREDLPMSDYAWAKIMALAERYGWEPGVAGEIDRALTGKGDPIDPVIPADIAQSLADALERALTDIPDDKVPLPPPPGLSRESQPEEVRSNLLEFFSGPETKRELTNVIAFFRQGPVLVDILTRCEKPKDPTIGQDYH